MTFCQSPTGGQGVALNVRARLEFGGRESGVSVETVPTSLAPGASQDLRLNGSRSTDWSNVAGRIEYSDVAGGSWQTEFRITQEGGTMVDGRMEGGRLYFEVLDTEQFRWPDKAPRN